MNSFDAPNKPQDDLIICRCEGVNLRQIQSAIKLSGAQTVNQVKKLTRAGMGLCQGRTCAKVIESILDIEGQAPSGTEPYQARPPVRGVAVAVLANGADQFDEPAGPVSLAMTRGADDDSAKKP
jgi:bacterioferritin-associated ferredoxin